MKNKTHKISPINKASLATAIALAILALAIVYYQNLNPLTTKDSYYEQLTFINYYENKIYAFDNKLSKTYTSLIKDLKNGNKPLTILHIGDSHIQADFFTGEARKLLSEWLNQGAIPRGFTFPYQIAGTNNPDDYTMEWKGQWNRIRPENNSRAKLGIAGIAISTSDKNSEFTLRLNKPWDETGKFNMIRLYFDSKDENTFPLPKGKCTLIEKHDGTALYKLPSFTDTLTISINWGNPNHKLTIYGLELLNSEAKMVYHAAGVNGASTQTFLQSENFAQQLNLLNPSMVIVSLGTNDAYNNHFNANSFRANLSNLVTIVKSTLPDALVILATPNDHLVDKQHDNPFIIEAQNQIFSVAHEMECGVWDFYTIMGGHGSIMEWEQHGLSSADMLHLNRDGYKLKGKFFFEALVKLSGEEQKLPNNMMMVNE